MSLHPQPLAPIPTETMRVARAAFPKGALALDLRDRLGGIYQDELFAPLFSPLGQPALAPWRLALVSWRGSRIARRRTRCVRVSIGNMPWAWN